MKLEYFILIDRIVSIDLDSRTIEAQAQVPATSTIFEGHFPGFPLMPGVLLIEAMAQASGWLVLGLTQFKRMPFLAAVKEAKLRSFVVPGTVLRVRAALVHEGSGYAVTKAEITAEEKAVCSSELTFRLTSFPNPIFRAELAKVAEAISFPFEVAADG
jgi:3-hydroxyacyl-[acyl-carrier-protein] dehydratase